MESNESISMIADKTKSSFLSILEEMISMAECIIPLDDEDGKAIDDGIEALREYYKGLSMAETPKEINKFINLENIKYSDDIPFHYEFDERDFSDFMEHIERLVYDGDE